MKYEGALFRPPSESQSLLIQMTVGCSYNKCVYCAMYDEVEFKLKPIGDVIADVREGSTYRFKRVFLCDGDALIAPQPYLVEVLSEIGKTMPGVERVGIYGDCRSILKKKPAELKRLNELGLKIIYHGIESGDDQTLKAVKKGAKAEQIIEAGRRVREAGISYSAIVMLGLGGRERTREHAVETARVLNAIQPDFIGVLTTMVVEDTPLDSLVDRGAFTLPSKLGLLEELKMLVEHLELKRGLMSTKHASNYLNLRIVFPYEKDKTVGKLAGMLDNPEEAVLKPDWMRGL